MAKKKKKKTGRKNAASPVVTLARVLDGTQQEQQGLSAACGLGEREFAEALAAARELSKSPDPRRIVELPAVFQEAFLHLVVARQDEDLLGDLLAMARDKRVAKEARRLLHHLRSRGVDIDVTEPAGESILQRQVVTEEPELDCFLSPPEADGTRFLWMARYTQGGVSVCQVAVNDTAGLSEFNAGVVGRNAYRRMVKELIADRQLPLRTISYAEARQRLAQAVELANKSGYALPEQYLKFSAEMPAVHPVQLPDPRRAFTRPDDERLRDLAGRAGELFELEEFRAWTPGEDDITALGKKFEEIESSSVIVTASQRVEQIERAIDKLVEQQVEGERRARLVSRLFEMADFLEASGRSEQAQICAAVAWSLEPDDSPPLESKFLERLIRRGLKSAEEIAQEMKPLPAAGEAGNQGDKSSSNPVTSP